MRVEKEDISPTLRAQMAGHPPVVCYPTEPITLDVYHLSASRGGQTLKARDYKDPQIVCYAEKRFFEWHEDDKSVNIRASSGSYGGGAAKCLSVPENGRSIVPNGLQMGSATTS